MKLKNVEDLDGTEIAAVDVCGNSNMVIIPKGTKLKKEYVNGLIGLDIHSIFIEESSETLSKMDPESNGQILPLEVIDYYIRYLQKIIEDNGEEVKKAPIFKFDLLAEKMIHYCRTHRNQKILIDFNREADIYEHTIYVTLLVVQIAIQFCVPTVILYQMVISCLIHDLGLLKLGNLDNEKMNNIESLYPEVFQTHPEEMYQELHQNRWIGEMGGQMVRYHHCDGATMKKHFNATKLPVECGIIYVSDFFDRSVCGIETGKKDRKEIKEILQNDVGTCYDKKVVNILYERIAYED